MRIDLVDLDQQEIVKVTLSRRNLRALLAKLDGHPAPKCLYDHVQGRGLGPLVAQPVVDFIFFGADDQEPGPMVAETEAQL